MKYRTVMNNDVTRLLSIFVAFALSMIGIDAFAWDIVVKNSNGTTIFYRWLNSDTELVVSNNGSNCHIGNVVIPANVTYNGKTYPMTSRKNAFQACRSLASWLIPNYVTSIEDQTFEACCKLKTSISRTVRGALSDF